VKTPLSLERFRALLAAYGARPELWPDTERAAALALRDASVEARALFDEEAGLDATLGALPEPYVSPDFLRRLKEVPLRAPQKRRWFALPGMWIPAVSWAFAAVLGLGLGFSTDALDTGEADGGSTVATVDSAAPSGEGAAATGEDDFFSALALDALDELEE
jgi:hypothetical protein